MKINTVKGMAEWLVEGKIRARYSSDILRNKSLHLIGYLEMYDKWDSIELKSYAIMN